MKKEYPDILKLEGEKWHNPDPATGKLGTRVPAEWLQTTEDSLKSLTLEMLEVLKAAGINPNELNNTQVRDAIQKMILARVINYNDITGRPIVKDSLGDDRNNPASQRVVNDVNRDVVTAQKTANNAHALAQSKQDKLPFVGDGPEVMKTGAYGLGGVPVILPNINDATLANGFYKPETPPEEWLVDGVSEAEDIGVLVIQRGSRPIALIVSNNQNLLISRYNGSSWGVANLFYTTRNTSRDKSGFLRTVGSANALTESDRTSSLGTSTTLVATQKLVNDVANQMIGFKQKWEDVTAQRKSGVSYVNSTNKPIMVSITASKVEGMGQFAGAKVDDVVIFSDSSSLREGFGMQFSFIVPSGSKYSVYVHNLSTLSRWSELR